MTAVLLGHWEPGSPEWHAARADGLGGSEIAPILGLSPFESRFALWFRKQGVLEPVDESPEMEWGKRLEPAVLAKFRDEHPELSLPSEPAGTWRHADRAYQIANPDLIGDGVLVESKCSRDSIGWGEPGTDEIPVYYRVQVQWYLDTFGLGTGHVCVLIGGNDYREYVIEYDAREAAELRAAAVEFLTTIRAGERPNLDGHAATYAAVKELHPEIEPVSVELPDELVQRYLTARAGLAVATESELHARSEVADFMGSAQTATWGDFTIAKRQARGDGTPFVVCGRRLPDLSMLEGVAA